MQCLDDKIEVGDDERGAGYLKNVRAKARNFLLDVNIGALHQSHHGDERGNSHGEPNHRQHGAQLVLAQRFDALAEVIGERQHSDLYSLPLFAEPKNVLTWGQCDG